MKIALITDGSNSHGLGHVYQSLSLADALREKCGAQAELYFLTKSAPAVCALIASRGFAVDALVDDAALLQRLQADRPDRIIFDKMDVAPELARAIKQKLAAKLITFTNLTEANRYADMTVLAEFDPEFSNLRSVDPISGQVSFKGIKYWILRPQFYALAPKHVAPGSEVQKIMLMFGGADPCNFSSNVLEALLATGSPYDILLVLGSAFEREAELDAMLARHAHGKVAIKKNVTNVAREMQDHDLVIVSPGMSFFETLVAGTPVLCFHQNEFQREAYAGVFPTLGLDDLPALAGLMAGKKFIYPENLPLERMAIGRGREQVLDEILDDSMAKLRDVA